MSPVTRKSSVVRREEIANAVLRIIGQQGLASLSTSTIASEVGLTTGALFRHFASLEDIYREVVRLAVIKIDETFPDETLPPLERLFTLAKSRIRLLSPNPGLTWLLRSEQAYLMLPADAVQELRSVAKRSHQFLLKAIKDGAADGSIRSDIPSEVLLVPVIGTIHTLIGTPSISKHGEGKPQRYTSSVLHALEIMIKPSTGHSS